MHPSSRAGSPFHPAARAPGSVFCIKPTPLVAAFVALARSLARSLAHCSAHRALPLAQLSLSLAQLSLSALLSCRLPFPLDLLDLPRPATHVLPTAPHHQLSVPGLRQPNVELVLALYLSLVLLRRSSQAGPYPPHSLSTRIDASISPSGLAEPPCLLHPRLHLARILPLAHLALRPRLVGPILRPPLPRRRGPPSNRSRLLLRCPEAHKGNPHHRPKPPVPMGPRRQTLAPRGQPLFCRPHSGSQRRAPPIPTAPLLHSRRPRKGHPYQPLHFQTHKWPRSPKVERHGTLFEMPTLISSPLPRSLPLIPCSFQVNFASTASVGHFFHLPAISPSAFRHPPTPPPFMNVPDLICYSRSSHSNTVAHAVRHTRIAQQTTSRHSCPISCPSHNTCRQTRAYFALRRERRL